MNKDLWVFSTSVNLMLYFFFLFLYSDLTQHQIILEGCSELFIGSLKGSMIAL